MTISNELLDELLKGCKRPEDLLGDAGLMKELKIRLMERMLGAELTAHLGYEVGVDDAEQETCQHQANCNLGINARSAVVGAVEISDIVAKPGKVENSIDPNQDMLVGNKLAKRSCNEQLQLIPLLATQHARPRL